MHSPSRIALILVMAVLAAACSAVPDGGRVSPDGGDSRGGDSGGATAVGPGISIDEAMASTLDGPLLVNGYIVASGDEVKFCSALAESYPPQCAGSSLTVEGLDLDSVGGLSSASGVTWSDEQVQLLGAVEDGVLRVEAGALP